MLKTDTRSIQSSFQHGWGKNSWVERGQSYFFEGLATGRLSCSGGGHGTHAHTRSIIEPNDLFKKEEEDDHDMKWGRGSIAWWRPRENGRVYLGGNNQDTSMIL